MDIAELVNKLSDDAEFDLGGENGKIKGADLKAQFSALNGQLTERQKQIDATNARLRQLEDETGKMTGVFGEAARAAAAEEEAEKMRLAQERRTKMLNPEKWEEWQNDPVFGPFANTFENRVLGRIRLEIIDPLIEGELKPSLQRLARDQELISGLALDSRQREEFRSFDDWPDDYKDFEKVREYGRSKKYFAPRGEQRGYVDMRRIHDEITGPIQRQKEADRIREEAREETLKELRAAGQQVTLPARSMGTPPKVVKAKGRNADEIFTNVLAEAGADREMQKMLSQING
jgi:hypothetical protein